MRKVILNTRERVQLDCSQSSLTKQYFKDECDINNIVQRFSETGQISSLNNMKPQYGNSPSMDLKQALDSIDNLRSEYSSLSEDQKSIFGHNMNNYAQFLSDYDISPESFIQQQSPESDTTASKIEKVDESTALGSSEARRSSET